MGPEPPPAHEKGRPERTPPLNWCGERALDPTYGTPGQFISQESPLAMRPTVLGSPQCRKLQSQISKHVHVNPHGQIEIEDDRCSEPNDGCQIGGNIRLERDKPAEAYVRDIADLRGFFNFYTTCLSRKALTRRRAIVVVRSGIGNLPLVISAR